MVCQGGFCPGGFCLGGFGKGVLSGGFCLGGFCPRTAIHKQKCHLSFALTHLTHYTPTLPYIINKT